VVAFDQHTSIAQLIYHLFAFAATESCGKCVPCRLGMRRIEQIFARLAAGERGTSAMQQEWSQIVRALQLGSLCGFGGGMADFAMSIDRYFGKELAACFD
jgi:NADH:ubiquinone oxidoreductase subunit F (NADH-binding)